MDPSVGQSVFSYSSAFVDQPWAAKIVLVPRRVLMATNVATLVGPRTGLVKLEDGHLGMERILIKLTFLSAASLIAITPWKPSMPLSKPVG